MWCSAATACLPPENSLLPLAIGVAELVGSTGTGQACVWGRPLPLSVLREGYNNPPVSGENLIGLSRARRPHNAIFVNFEEDEVPMQPLEAAVQTWKRVCTNPVDRKVEEELRKVSRSRPAPTGPPAPAPVYPARPCPSARCGRLC